MTLVAAAVLLRVESREPETFALSQRSANQTLHKRSTVHNITIVDNGIEQDKMPQIQNLLISDTFHKDDPIQIPIQVVFDPKLTNEKKAELIQDEPTSNETKKQSSYMLELNIQIPKVPKSSI